MPLFDGKVVRAVRVKGTDVAMGIGNLQDWRDDREKIEGYIAGVAMKLRATLEAQLREAS